MGDKIGATKVAEAVVANLFPIPRHLCVANVSWSLLSYEADLLCMTQSGYLIEVEVKISLADLKRDAGKRKWESRDFRERVSRFYYAMPEALWEKPSTREHVRPGAGVIVVGEKARIEVEAERTSARPLSAKDQFDLARVGSYRAWGPQQRHRLRQLKAEQKLRDQERALRWQQMLAERKDKAA